jgi:hypothetical protein
VLLEEVLSWVRALPGSQRLRALVVFDEVYGFLPPHPQNPPTKRPLVALMKQARAFGVGVLIATQNPMDLDYRPLGNAGLWCIGRLQTDADRARVLDGLAGAGGEGELSAAELSKRVERLSQRWFLLRDAHAKDGMLLMQPRWAMSFMRGPMTRTEIRRALAGEDARVSTVLGGGARGALANPAVGPRYLGNVAWLRRPRVATSLSSVDGPTLVRVNVSVTSGAHFELEDAFSMLAVSVSYDRTSLPVNDLVTASVEVTNQTAATQNMAQQLRSTLLLANFRGAPPPAEDALMPLPRSPKRWRNEKLDLVWGV